MILKYLVKGSTHKNAIQRIVDKCNEIGYNAHFGIDETLQTTIEIEIDQNINIQEAFNLGSLMALMDVMIL